MLSHFSCVQLFAMLLTVALQAPLSMGFLRQEYWSGLPCHPPGDRPNPRTEPESLKSPALVGEFFPICRWFFSTTWEAHVIPKLKMRKLGHREVNNLPNYCVTND